ncbi:MAG: hypothetical protein MRZ79_11265 [Bacteroidia bacterium]|nr:hypothetical protein [Bacteroidia bacterium]
MGVNIDIYLRNAFKELDAFSLPEIGTFRKVHLSARMDENLQKVFPPRIEIEFSPQVDTRLNFSRYLTQQIQMPQDEADRIVRDICWDIERIVNEEGQFQLPEIGTLVKSQNGRYHFMADQKSQEVFSGDLFGLEPVTLTNLPVVTEEYVSLEHEETSMNQPIPKEQTPPKNKRSGFPTLAVLLALLIAGTGAVFVWQNQSLTRSSLQDQQFLSVIPAEPKLDKFLADNKGSKAFDKEPNQPGTNSTSRLSGENSKGNSDKKEATSTEGKKAKESTEKKVDADKFIAQADKQTTRDLQGGGLGLPRGKGDDGNINDLKVDKTTARLAKPASTFHLITGSFGQAKTAEVYKSKLLKQGYKQVEILHAPDIKKYRVSVFSSNSPEEVKIFQGTLKEQRGVEGWILEEK